MDEERVTERVDASGRVTERTVERTPVARRSGGSFLWILIALVAVAVAAYFLMNMSESEGRKDDAIAGAASEVGDAAEKVGDAVEDTAKKLND